MSRAFWNFLLAKEMALCYNKGVFWNEVVFFFWRLQMQIKAAVFDMDGTIVNSLMFWEHLWKRIGERYMGDASFQPCEEVE